jgi:hypothetical protein
VAAASRQVKGRTISTVDDLVLEQAKRSDSYETNFLKEDPLRDCEVRECDGSGRDGREARKGPPNLNMS